MVSFCTLHCLQNKVCISVEPKCHLCKHKKIVWVSRVAVVGSTQQCGYYRGLTRVNTGNTYRKIRETHTVFVFGG